MTIVTAGSDEVVEQITKHLNRLVDVVKVVDLTEGAHIERELMLIKVRAVGKEREEMKRMADIFRGRIIDVTDKSYTIRSEEHTSELQSLMRISYAVFCLKKKQITNAHTESVLMNETK